MSVQTQDIFPNPLEINGDIVAVGGSLEPDFLLAAYKKGIFPWFSDDDPICWWSPDPRFVVLPSQFHVSRRLRRFLRKNPYKLTLDKAFEQVVNNCRLCRIAPKNGTWITPDMVDAYLRLHQMGYAHSVEAWYDDELAGGLYGVSLGGCFFGESMFYNKENASKTAFTALAATLFDAGFGLIDCQQRTDYLLSFGGQDIDRCDFLDLLNDEFCKDTFLGFWDNHFPQFPLSPLWSALITGESH